MKRKEKINYLNLGIFITLGIFLISFSVFFAGNLKYFFHKGLTLYVMYDNVDGLTEGATVAIGGGVPIGKVESLDFVGNKVKATLFLEAGVQINDQATFHIISDSLVGGKHLEIMNYLTESEDPNLTFLHDKQVLQGVSPVGMTELLAGFTDSIDKDQISEMVQNLSITINEIRIFSQKINSLTNDPNSILSLLDNKEVTVDFVKIISNLEEFTWKIQEKPNSLTLGKAPKRKEKNQK